MKYRKKPVEVEAVQWTGSNRGEVEALMEKSYRRGFISGKYIDIPTLEGIMSAGPSDWIILGVQNELYPCKDDIFKATYEKV